MVKFKVKINKNFFHGPRWNFIGINKQEFNLKVYFWENCNYVLTNNIGQVNKLYGHSFNLFPWFDKKDKKWKSGHHKNSIRFGWRSIDSDKIELIAYVYVNGERAENVITTIRTEEWTHLNFQETAEFYIFRVIRQNGDSGLYKFRKSITKKGFLNLFIFRLYPYFGGEISAPHNMTISLKYLKKFI